MKEPVRHMKEPVFICEECQKECSVEKKVFESMDDAIFNRSACCGGLAYVILEGGNA